MWLKAKHPHHQHTCTSQHTDSGHLVHAHPTHARCSIVLHFNFSSHNKKHKTHKKKTQTTQNSTSARPSITRPSVPPPWTQHKSESRSVLNLLCVCVCVFSLISLLFSLWHTHTHTHIHTHTLSLFSLGFQAVCGLLFHRLTQQPPPSCGVYHPAPTLFPFPGVNQQHINGCGT